MSVKLRDEGIKPFLRWAGGKKWLVAQIGDLIANKEFSDYHEPFLGGGSVLFSLEISDASAFLSDINEELIEAYKAVRDNPKEVIKRLKKYENSKEFYYKLREKKPRNAYEKAARFIFLNHTSFNGLYRVNKKGEYNVPYGYRKSYSLQEQEILDASGALQGTELSVAEFDQNIDNIKKNSLVFLDPPYTVSKDTNGFIEYNSKIFSIEDQIRLANFAQELDRKGAYYIITNAEHKKIREIFKDCGTALTVSRQSLIGGKNARRGLIDEVVFTNL